MFHTERGQATRLSVPDQRYPLCHRTAGVINRMSLVPFKRPSARRLSGGARGDRVARTLIGFSLAAGRPAHDQVIATAPRLLASGCAYRSH